MSFRGKVVKREKIGPVEMITTEYPDPKRKKTIWWMGEMKAIHLGELIIHYIAERRESDFEKIKWRAFFYQVKLNENADASDAVEECYPVEIEKDGTYSFDDLDDAETFINEVKCTLVSVGLINIGSRAEFERWVKALEMVAKEEAEDGY